MEPDSQVERMEGTFQRAADDQDGPALDERCTPWLHGEGRVTMRDGACYEGGFQDGLYHGQGVYRCCAPSQRVPCPAATNRVGKLFRSLTHTVTISPHRSESVALPCPRLQRVQFSPALDGGARGCPAPFGPRPVHGRQRGTEAHRALRASS